ncbi:UbiA prenyltransferase family-domain-containing protein [Stachybotrys elegans]|uniref:Diterpenoid pyrone biosynthesis cluster protein C n=1 Tax=Stachybotrys elegans TaxID=80388 RepID=A0A8K0SVE3_9HYPO|nr:UbiA prenyltransferase family-domain-containing protein [Stachybotrys elegans]
MSSLPKADKAVEDAELSQQYGGRHTGKWVSKLPASWIPYVQLARLSPPAGVFLVFFPHLFGVVHGSILKPVPLTQTVRAGALMGLGSFFLSNAIHGWNDLIDAPLDAQVERTKDRPIPRGDVSPRGALIFTLTQALAGAGVLYYLPPATAWTVLPSIVANYYYPYSKRHTNFPQVVLGVALGWGVNVGTAAMGIVPWEHPALIPTACLFTSSVLWTVIYDTIYAFQDIEDDTKVGIGSTAVFFRNSAKPFLWTCLTSLVGLLGYYGTTNNLGPAFYGISVGGCVASLGAMIANVDLQESASCWWWFRYGFWLAGGSIAGGLLSQFTKEIAGGVLSQLSKLF